VAYALSRGIRVVPEFEMPGHAFGLVLLYPSAGACMSNCLLPTFRFGVGYPYMVANCPTYTTDINTIPLNVASDDMYNFLLAFFSEMSTVFTDEFIHTVPSPTSYHHHPHR
jgi:hexosaminidase